ncbi:hypothetical protein PM082_021057 [Marasmius tenuissimus]|nr:hypothetical protein PM082_021057 [Marasmius tenuissimus]
MSHGKFCQLRLCKLSRLSKIVKTALKNHQKAQAEHWALNIGLLGDWIFSSTISRKWLFARSLRAAMGSQ